MKALDSNSHSSRYLLLLPTRVPKVGRDDWFCSLTLCVLNMMWLQAVGRGFSLWASLPLFHGVLAAVEVLREELSFPLNWIKFIIKKAIESFRLFHICFCSCIDPQFLFGIPFWKTSDAERSKIIYRVSLLKWTRIEWDWGKGQNCTRKSKSYFWGGTRERLRVTIELLCNILMKRIKWTAERMRWVVEGPCGVWCGALCPPAAGPVLHHHQPPRSLPPQSPCPAMLLMGTGAKALTEATGGGKESWKELVVQNKKIRLSVVLFSA